MALLGQYQGRCADATGESSDTSRDSDADDSDTQRHDAQVCLHIFTLDTLNAFKMLLKLCQVATVQYMCQVCSVSTIISNGDSFQKLLTYSNTANPLLVMSHQDLV